MKYTFINPGDQGLPTIFSAHFLEVPLISTPIIAVMKNHPSEGSGR